MSELNTAPEKDRTIVYTTAAAVVSALAAAAAFWFGLWPYGLLFVGVAGSMLMFGAGLHNLGRDTAIITIVVFVLALVSMVSTG